MPFKGASDKSLPGYVKKLPSSLRSKWVKMFNRVFAKEGEEVAFIATNTWLKKQLKKKVIVLRANTTRDIVRFEIETENAILTRGDDGEEYITAVLATTGVHYDGRQFTKDLLLRWVEEINNNPIIGDGDHEYAKTLMRSSMSNSMIQEMLKSKPGIAKAISAFMDGEKLKVRLAIDKRYRNRVLNSKGLSVECGFDSHSGKSLISDATLLAFTFNINSNPAITGTGVAA